MKLRRLISSYTRRGQSLSKGSVVRHSKIALLMTLMGHERQIDRLATWRNVRFAR